MTSTLGAASTGHVPQRDLRVDDVMTRSIISLRSTDTLRAAAEMLVLKGVGGAPVQLGGGCWERPP